MKWGTRYAHYTTIKRAIILYYVHYIAIIMDEMNYLYYYNYYI